MDADKNSSNLRHLVEEYVVTVELRRHDRVSQLSSIIISNLVELLDDDLDGGAELYGNSSDDKQEFHLEIGAIDAICSRLRDQGHIAAIYDNVIEFVQLRDLVCLSRLLGVVGPDARTGVGIGHGSNEDDDFDFDLMAKILRQSIQLLRFINSSSGNKPVQEIWFDRSCLERRAGIGFPKYFLDINEALSIKVRDNNLELMLASLNNPELDMIGAKKVISLIKTDWFNQFLQRTLMPPYPVDRFTILVAIWLIGVKCRHRALEQLIGELVEQVYHEEVNSCSIEDLMLLTQVGSIWLSYHKRHQATMRQTNKQAADDDEISDDEPEDEDGDLVYPNSSQTSSSSSPEVINEVNWAQRAKLSQVAAGSLGGHQQQQMTDLRLKLRHLIDAELLHGRQCQICGHRQTDLMGPIKMDHHESTCTVCGLNLAGLSLSCALSHRRLEILDLGSVLQLFKSSTKPIKTIALVSSSEWLREVLKYYGGLVPFGHVYNDGDGDDDIDGQVGERVDISDKFERLTMMRGEERTEVEAKAESKYLPDKSGDSDSDDDDSLANSSDESQQQHHQNVGDNYSQFGVAIDDNHNPLMRNFMKARQNYLPTPLQAGANSSSPSKPSESLMMIKFLKTNSGARQEQDQQAHQVLPTCLTDLLLLDTCGGASPLARLGVVESGGNLLADGSIWQCSGRSKISGLLQGCGRAFCSLELIRLTGQGSCLSPEQFNCPLCGQHLYKVRLLDETLEP